MLNPNFVLVGILIGAIGSLSYLIDTVRGKIKPNRVSFFMWSIAPLIAFAAEVKEGVGIQSIMTFSIGFFPLIIFIATFVNKKAEWKLTPFDLACGILSFVGLFLWYITKVGNIAIFFSVLADGLAAIPTIVKSYHFPETERPIPWLSSSINGLFTTLTIKTWNFSTYGFPVYYLIVTLIIFILVQFKIGKKYNLFK